ncbi:MAG: J domain-containing protein [Deltaproteobacteria bacterium]|nr:J domain-containing protein [Deltaproteobacteria bacterium]
MSYDAISRRLSRLVRAEARALHQRLRRLAEGRPPAEPAAEDPSRGRPRPGQPADPGDEARIAACYANLELPYGASLTQVKQAYRRLLSRYHPDRHATDAGRQEVANEVTLQLRRAYEALLEHLQGQP